VHRSLKINYGGHVGDQKRSLITYEPDLRNPPIFVPYAVGKPGRFYSGANHPPLALGLTSSPELPEQPLIRLDVGLGHIMSLLSSFDDYSWEPKEAPKDPEPNLYENRSTLSHGVTLKPLYTSAPSMLSSPFCI
jgi:hypothetical protein